MALVAHDHAVTPADVYAAAGIDPASGRGASAAQLRRAVRKLGGKPGRAVRRVPGGAAGDEVVAEELKALRRDLRRGAPTVMRLRLEPKPAEPRFVLAVLLNAEGDELFLYDPAGDEAMERVPVEDLAARWVLPGKGRRRELVRMPVSVAGELSLPTCERAGHCPLDYARHVRKLRAGLPRLKGRFAVVVKPPFVVVGDSGLADVRRHADRLVARTGESLRRQYGMRDPERILDVWLFAGAASYEVNARRLTGEEAGTPFGFYSARHDALIMNARTGGGTLVHELVHPYVEANFPDCPPWFNEALGSLYEAVGWPGGEMRGYVNWRLPGLQQALQASSVPSFEWLMRQTDQQFYNADPGTNYGQARYLAYYLQERGLLIPYYRRFLAQRALDPTGYDTLLDVLELEPEDVPAFRKRWERFVMGLSWGREG